MKSDAHVDEVGLGTSRSGCGIGCAITILGLIVGIGLAWWQNSNIEDTWTYCMHAPVDSVVDASRGQDVSQVSWSALLIRVAAYSLCFLLPFCGARRLGIKRSGVTAMVSGIIASTTLCSVLFISDFALFNGMSRVSNIEKYCPGGRPPWWPSWLPQRVSKTPLSPVYTG